VLGGLGWTVGTVVPEIAGPPRKEPFRLGKAYSTQCSQVVAHLSTNWA
jgi:hypothetical protein